MKKILILFAYVIPLATVAQEYTTIYGTVYDQADSTTIPYAHIFVEKAGVGIATNKEGRFRLVIPVRYAKNKIRVSCIGYKSELFVRTNKEDSNHAIYLTQNKTMLSEVVVKSKDAIEILKQSVKNIPINYPRDKYTYDLFFKEVGKINSDYYSFQEVAISIVSGGFSDKYVGGKDYPAWIRGKRTSHYYSPKFGNGNGVFVAYWLNWARGILNKKGLKKYVFDYEGIAQYKDKEVYKVVGESSDFDSLTLYITTDKYALVYIRLDYENNIQTQPKGKYHTTWWPKEYNFEVSFVEFENLWHIASVHDHRHNGLLGDSTLQITRDIQVNGMKKEKKLPKRHKINPDTDLFSYPLPYDPVFWESYNAPLQTEAEKRIKKDLERNGVSLQEQFEKSSVE